MNYVTAVIEINNLTRRFGDITAVDSLDLSIEKGEIYGLLGPNGAGKTTTIKILCNLLRYDSGEVKVMGKPVYDPGVVSIIGYMPQETALYNDITAVDNIRFFGRIYGLKGEELEKRSAELFRLVDLEGREKNLVRELSGGMRHRLSLACALVHKPKLAFLDEPTVGVDPELRLGFWNHFKSMAKNDTTIILTTHYMEEARRCNRVCFLTSGKKIAEDRPGVLMKKTGSDTLENAFLKYARGAVK